jgi:aminoglycoside phosphotransferase (APT) family kinase protein
VRRLLARRLLAPGDVLRRGVSIEDASGRHRVLCVAVAGGPGWLVKQAAGPRGRAAIRHEAAVYRLLARAPAPVAGAIPALAEHDEDDGILILELVSGTAPVVAEGDGRAAAAAAAALGGFLGRLHAWGRAPAREARGRGPAPRFTGGPPWVLSLDRPTPGDLRTLSGGNLELIREVQRSTRLRAALAELRRAWRPLTLVHHDLRPENCRVRADPATGRVRALVVDWELADLGDPAWDVGSAVAGWIGAAALPRDGAGGAAARRQRWASARRAVRALWAGYLGTGTGGTARAALARRAMRFAGARLLQRAFETLQLRERANPAAADLVHRARTLLLEPGGALAAGFGPGSPDPSSFPRLPARWADAGARALP